ncbi:MAG: CBS domain-containing protein [Oscillospiraceae bacterium]|nr:CBS domain-containing protein [Oscillospiraceae bacterium]
MTVRRIMNSNVVYLTPDDTAARAARLLHRHNIGMLPVCSKDGRLRGIVTDRDIAVRCVALDNPAEDTKLREIMTRGVVTASPDDDVSDAARIMASEQIRRLPVVENNKVIGILALADLAQRQSLMTEASSALSEISMPKRRFPHH